MPLGRQQRGPDAKVFKDSMVLLRHQCTIATVLLFGDDTIAKRVEFLSSTSSAMDGPEEVLAVIPLLLHTTC